MTAASALNCGDIIYSFPLLRKLWEATGRQITLQICPTHPRWARGQKANTYKALKRLAEAQPYISRCEEIAQHEIEKAGIQLDKFLKHPDFKKKHIALCHIEMQGLTVEPGDLRPWLECADWFSEYTAVAWTGKFNNHNVELQKLLSSYPAPDELLFVGLPSEVPTWWPYRVAETADLLELARVLERARALICDQSAPLAIAQGLGIPQLLAKDGRLDNCSLHSTIHIQSKQEWFDNSIL